MGPIKILRSFHASSTCLLILLMLTFGCGKVSVKGNSPSSISVSAPVAEDISPLSFDEDAEEIITLSYSVSDAHLASSCSISSVNNITVSGACACDISGVCTVGVTGLPNYHGAAVFDYSVASSQGTSNLATAILIIDPVDDAPVSASITPAAFVEENQSIIALSYTDLEGDKATACSISALTNVSVTRPCDCDGLGVCSVGVTGATNYSGPASFTYTVTANNLTSNSATSSMTILDISEVPRAFDIAPLSFNEDTQSTITLSYSDPEGALATSCSVSALSNITVTQACSCDGAGICTVGVKGTANYYGTAGFNYIVSLPSASTNSATASLMIDPVDDAPVVAPLSPPTFAEDAQAIISLPYTDPEGHLATACSVSALNNVSVSRSCACDVSGICTVGVTSNANYYGPAGLSFTVTTNTLTSNSANATFTITNVDDAPVAANITPPSFLGGVQEIITLSYTDIEGELATACTPSALVNVTVTQACVCSGSGVCTIGVTGTSGHIGQASLSYQITAGGALSNAATATLDLGCPTGHVHVPKDDGLGVNAFCVMKYEAKKSGTTPTSEPAGTPWVSISLSDAKTACTSLGNKFDLISNSEWMAVARNIEAEASNWSSGTVNSGMINRGHSDNSPDRALAVTNPADPYNNTGNTALQAIGSGQEQKRTHTLENPNSDEIWDLSGNVYEWVDWQTAEGLQIVTPINKAFASPPDMAPVTAWREFTALTDKISGADEMSTETWQAANPALNSSNGIGMYYSGLDDSGGTAHRGGNWNQIHYAGIYALNLNDAPSLMSIGFRCVFRP